jgi:hypothetical protein
MSLSPNEDILTKEIESWRSFVDGLSSKEEDRDLSNNILDDYYNYAAAINAKGQPFPTEPLLMALLLYQHKMIDWLIEVGSKQESDNKEVERSKEEEQNLGRENKMIISERMKEFIILMIISNRDCTLFYEFSS